MRRDTLEYARPQPPVPIKRRSKSLAHLALAIAIVAGALEASLVGLVWLGTQGGYELVPLAAAGFAAILVLVCWVVVVALALASLGDRDGPRGIAALALLVMMAEAAVAVELFILRTS